MPNIFARMNLYDEKIGCLATTEAAAEVEVAEKGIINYIENHHHRKKKQQQQHRLTHKMNILAKLLFSVRLNVLLFFVTIITLSTYLLSPDDCVEQVRFLMV